MSILDACACRLVWDPSRGGSATRKGVTVKLDRPPDLGRGEVYAVDWAPCVVYSVTRHISLGPEMLEPDEIAAARAIVAAVESRPADL